MWGAVRCSHRDAVRRYAMFPDPHRCTACGVPIRSSPPLSNLARLWCEHSNTARDWQLQWRTLTLTRPESQRNRSAGLLARLALHAHRQQQQQQQSRHTTPTILQQT